jgi:hypothetical protein
MGEVRAHKNALNTRQYVGMTKQERVHTTTWCDAESTIDDAKHAIDPALVTDSKDEMKVWAYLMTQYNLKPGLHKFGRKGEKAAMDKLTQLHVMNTWTAMDPTK